MMKRYILIAVIAALVGFVGGNAFWYLVSPMWIDVEVSENISAGQTASVLGRGEFSDIGQSYKGRGDATIYQSATGERVLRLSDFEVTNGPDLKVWLVEAANPTKSEDVTGGKWVSLGRLKGNIGDQNYDIGPEVDLSNYGAVVIWCEQFSVLFSTASLAR